MEVPLLFGTVRGKGADITVPRIRLGPGVSQIWITGGASERTETLVLASDRGYLLKHELGTAVALQVTNRLLPAIRRATTTKTMKTG